MDHQNHSGAPNSCINFGQLKKLLSTIPGITAKRLSAATYHVVLIARGLADHRGLSEDPMSLPADPRFVERLLSELDMTPVAPSRATWKNAASDYRLAVAKLGLDQRKHAPALTAEWNALLGRLPPVPALRPLKAFAARASAQGVSPLAVDTAVLVLDRQHLLERYGSQVVSKMTGQLIRALDAARPYVTQWANADFSLPSRKETYAAEENDVAPELIERLENYLETRRTKRVRIPGEKHRRPKLRPRSIKQIRRLFYRFIGALRMTYLQGGIDAKAVAAMIEAIRSLEDLITVEHFDRVADFYRDRFGRDESSMVRNMLVMLVGIARMYKLCDKTTLDALEDVAYGAKPDYGHMVEKNREFLRSVYHDENKAKLDQLPRLMLREAQRVCDRSGRVTRTATMLAQRAIAIEIELLAPMRIGNLTRLNLREHFMWPRPGSDRDVLVTVPGHQVKNGVPLRMTLPKETVELIQLYLDYYHPHIRGGNSPFLFPGKQKLTAKGEETLGNQISKDIKKFTGLKMTSHQFRHFAGARYLEKVPDGIEYVSVLLAHKNTDVTRSAYVDVLSGTLVKKFQDIVLEDRRKSQQIVIRRPRLEERSETTCERTAEPPEELVHA